MRHGAIRHFNAFSVLLFFFFFFFLFFFSVGAAFVRAEETSVAAAASGNQQYWIAGAIVGAIIVLVLIAALIYLIGRNGKTIRDKKDVAVGESPVLPKAEKLVSKQSSNLPGRFSRSSSKKTKSVSLDDAAVRHCRAK